MFVALTQKFYSSCTGIIKTANTRGAAAPDFDPARSRVNANVSNQAERALCYVMKQQQPFLTQKKVGESIGAIKGCKAVNQTTISEWHKTINATDFNLSNFILLKSGGGQSLSCISDKTVQALVEYLQGRELNAGQITAMLTKYFVSIRKFKLTDIQAGFFRLLVIFIDFF